MHAIYFLCCGICHTLKYVKSVHDVIGKCILSLVLTRSFTGFHDYAVRSPHLLAIMPGQDHNYPSAGSQSDSDPALGHCAVFTCLFTDCYASCWNTCPVRDLPNSRRAVWAAPPNSPLIASSMELECCFMYSSNTTLRWAYVRPVRMLKNPDSSVPSFPSPALYSACSENEKRIFYRCKV